MTQNHTVISGTLLSIVRGDLTGALVSSLMAPKGIGAALRTR